MYPNLLYLLLHYSKTLCSGPTQADQAVVKCPAGRSSSTQGNSDRRALEAAVGQGQSPASTRKMSGMGSLPKHRKFRKTLHWEYPISYQCFKLFLLKDVAIATVTTVTITTVTTAKHTGHIAPYFRGLPPNRVFFCKNYWKCPLKNSKTPFFLKMNRLNVISLRQI